MSDKKTITAEEAQSLCEEMERVNNGQWLRLKLHLDHDGEEIFFSFLMPDGSGLSDVLNIFLGSVEDALLTYPGTDFNMAFYRIQNGKQFILESFSDDEIRAPKTIEYPLGETPTVLEPPIPEEWWGI